MEWEESGIIERPWGWKSSPHGRVEEVLKQSLGADVPELQQVDWQAWLVEQGLFAVCQSITPCM